MEIHGWETRITCDQALLKQLDLFKYDLSVATHYNTKMFTQILKM